MAKKQKKPESAIPTTAEIDTVAIQPGWLVRDVSSASGGVKHDRQLIKEAAVSTATGRPARGGKGRKAEYKTKTTVDHVEICAAIDACVKRVDYALRKNCARTPFGWVTDTDGLARIRTEIAEIDAEATELNERARRAKSARRAYIGVVPAKIEVSTPEAVREIARTVRTVLTDVRDALRNGHVAELHKLKIRSINLDKLAVGFQADAIRFALERVPEATKELREAIKKGEDPAAAGAKLDLEVIEAAIVHFQESPDDALAEVA